jgi:hypothetical protein
MGKCGLLDKVGEMMFQKERGLLAHFRPNTGSWPELALCHYALHTKFIETIVWTTMGYSIIAYHANNYFKSCKNISS